MCMTNKDCQKCETCGLMKYQLWISPEMHDRGCPWGHAIMTECPDATNHAKRLHWMAQQPDLTVSSFGLALVAQMLAAGVDLQQPCVEVTP